MANEKNDSSDVEVVSAEVGKEENAPVREAPLFSQGKRRKISPVWEFAEKKSNDIAVCKICGREIGCPDSNTTNIKSHILGCHVGSEEAKILLSNIEEKSNEMKKKKNEKAKKEARNWRKGSLS